VDEQSFKQEEILGRIRAHGFTTEEWNAHLERSKKLFERLLSDRQEKSFAELAVLLREELYRLAFQVDLAAVFVQRVSLLGSFPGTSAGYVEMLTDARRLADLHALLKSLIPAEREVRALADRNAIPPHEGAKDELDGRTRRTA
jgi:hypothetical protein